MHPARWTAPLLAPAVTACGPSAGRGAGCACSGVLLDAEALSVPGGEPGSSGFVRAGGDRAVLDGLRWLMGATVRAGRLQDYRDYPANHEVGHVPGCRHAGCPGSGQVALVMLQQTLGLDGCLSGPSPHL